MSSSHGSQIVPGAKAAFDVPRLRCGLAQESLDFLAADEVSADFLRSFCETEDLLAVTKLEIQVDAVVQSVECLGDHLPNLRQLKLTDSSIMCLRDVGTSLVQLEVLWMSRCGLQELAGVLALPALREFYLPFNDVADLSPLSAHDALEVLDVEGNAITHLDEVLELETCSSLRELTLTGNPVCKESSFSRQAVLDLLPQIAVLDDVDRADDVLPESNILVCDPCDELDPGLRAPSLELEPSESSEDCGAFDLDSTDARLLDVEHEEPIAGSPQAAVRGTVLGVGVEDCERTGGFEVQSLKSTHPLLAQGLEECAADLMASRTASVGSRGPLYAGEPNEQDLVVEGIKRARPRTPLAHAFTARPLMGATPSSSSSFDFSQAPERRQAKTASVDSFRPATSANSGLHLDDLRVHSTIMTASDLTCGSPCAGNPFAVLRQRKHEALSSPSSKETEIDIRELLRRYQTYTQESCIPREELRSRKLEADTRRPGTPDVRIHTLGKAGQESGRLGSSSGLRGGLNGTLPRRSPTGGGLPPCLPSGPCSYDVDGGVPRPTMITSIGESLILDQDIVELE